MQFCTDVILATFTSDHFDHAIQTGKAIYTIRREFDYLGAGYKRPRGSTGFIEEFLADHVKRLGDGFTSRRIDGGYEEDEVNGTVIVVGCIIEETVSEILVFGDFDDRTCSQTRLILGIVFAPHTAIFIQIAGKLFFCFQL